MSSPQSMATACGSADSSCIAIRSVTEGAAKAASRLCKIASMPSISPCSVLAPCVLTRVTAAELSKAVEMVVDGQTYYELAYSNESSRGNNNFLSRVAVRGGRLYVMTLKARIDDAGALPELRQVAESFRVSGL